MDQRLILADQFLPRRDKQDLHLARVVPGIIEKLHIDVHIVDVERDVLLGLPLDRLLELFHRHEREVDPLDDDRVPRNRNHGFLGLHPRLVHKSSDCINDGPRVHHSAIDDGLWRKRLHRKGHKPVRARLGVVLQLHQLHTARSNIQTDGALITT